MPANHQLTSVFRGMQEVTGLNLDNVVVLHQRLQITAGIGAEQRGTDIVKCQTVAVHAGRIETNFQHRLVSSDAVNITRTGNALQLSFQRVGNPGQIGRADVLIGGRQGNGHDRDIVDAHGFYHRSLHAEVLRKPVIVAVDLVVQVQNGFFAWNAHFKGNRQHRLSGHADGKNIVHPFDFRQHLLGRN